MDGFRIFNDSQIATIINKGKTAVTCIQLDAVKAYAYGDFVEGDDLQLRATSLNLKVSQLENSSSMTDSEKADLAQGILVEGELEKIQKTYDYTSCTGVVSDITNLALPLNHLTDLTNVGTNTHVQIDAHIASTSNPHDTTVSQVVDESGLTRSKGGIVSFDENNDPVMQTVEFNRVLISDSNSPSGLSWGIIERDLLESYQPYSVLLRNQSTSGTPSYWGIFTDSVLGRLDGDITNIAVINDVNLSGNSASTLPTEQAVKGYVDDKLSETGYKFFVVNNGTYGQWDTIASNSVLGRFGGDIENISILDQDDMSSNSNSAIATQQSIKQYSDSRIASVLASSEVRSPDASRDGYAITYDHSSQSYRLTDVSGGAGLWTDDVNDTISYNTGSSPKVLIGGNGVDANAMLDVRGSAIFNEGGANADFRIESVGDEYAFFLDASSGHIGIGIQNPVYKFHINDGRFRIDAPSGESAVMRIHKQSSVFTDNVGTWHVLRNASDADTTYAATFGGIQSATAGSEFGKYEIQVIRNGTLSNAFVVRDDDYFFYDAETFNIVSEGSSSSIFFKADNSNGDEVDYAQISFSVQDNTLSSHDGSLTLGIVNQGFYTAAQTLNGQELYNQFNLPFVAYSNTQATLEALLTSTPVNGMIYYDTSLNKFRGRANGAWVDLH